MEPEKEELCKTLSSKLNSMEKLSKKLHLKTIRLLAKLLKSLFKIDVILLSFNFVE